MHTDAAFREGFVEADGFRIRYMEAGQGMPLVHLHGAGGMRLTRGHDLLSRHYRVIAFEMPGFGQSPENTRTKTISDLAATMASGGQCARHRQIQPDGNLVRRQGGIVAGGAGAGTGAGPGPGSAGSNPPCRDRTTVGLTRGNGAPALRPSRTPRTAAGHGSGSPGEGARVGRAVCAGPTATRISKRACAASQRRRWCCSAHSTA